MTLKMFESGKTTTTSCAGMWTRLVRFRRWKVGLSVGCGTYIADCAQNTGMRFDWLQRIA